MKCQTQMNCLEGKVVWDLWLVPAYPRGWSRRPLNAELISGAVQCKCTHGAIGMEYYFLYYYLLNPGK